MDLSDEKRLNEDQVKVLCSQIHKILQKPLIECSDQEIAKIVKIISNTQFFQRNLDSQINLDDFMQRITQYITYDVHPSGTILFQEGQYANRLSIIIKGSAVKLYPRPLAEIEEEAAKYQKQVQQEQDEEEYIIRKQNAYEAFQQVTIAQVDQPPIPNRRSNRSLSKVDRLKLTRGVSKQEEEPPKSPQLKRPGLLVPPEQIDSDSELPRDEIELNSFNSIDLSKSKSQAEANTATKVVLIKSSFDFPRKSSISGNTASSKRKDTKKLVKRPVVQEEFIKEFQETAEMGDDEEAKELKKKAELKRYKEMLAMQSDIKLFQEITKKNPQLLSKYFVGDIFKLKRIREYQPGNHFGESFLKTNKPKENLLVAAEEIHLITLTRDNYAKLMVQLHEKATEKLEYFSSVFPSINEELLKSFAYYFKEKSFIKAERIFTEEDTVDRVYLLQSGNVRLFKKPEDNASKRKLTNADALMLTNNKLTKPDIPVASVVEGQFFGEEVYLKESKRRYTAIAKLPTKVYYLDLWVYQKIKGFFVELLKELRLQASEKYDFREKRFDEMMDHVGPKIDTRVRSHSKHNSPLKDKSFEGPSLALKATSSMPENCEMGHYSESLSPDGRRLIESPIKGQDSFKSTEKAGPMTKNLMIYKEKFFRKTFMSKVTANQSFLKKEEEERERDRSKMNSFAVANSKDLEMFIPAKKDLKKTLSISTATITLPTMNLTRVFSTNSPLKELREAREKESTTVIQDGSLEFLDSTTNPTQPSQPSPKNLKILRSNVLQFLAPHYQEGAETVIKSPNGSMVVASASSKLRGLLRTLDNVPDLSDAIFSPGLSEKAILNPKRVQQQSPNAAKLKALRKLHVIREHFQPQSVSPSKVKPELLKTGVISRKLTSLSPIKEKR